MGATYKMTPEALLRNNPQFTVIFENKKTSDTFEESFANEYFYNKRMNRVNKGHSLRAAGITKHF